MPEGYDDILSMVVTELREKALHDLRQENTEHDARIKKMADLSQQVRNLLRAQSDDSWALVESYMEEKTVAQAVETDYLYMRGIKDFVLIFKSLGGF